MRKRALKRPKKSLRCAREGGGGAPERVSSNTVVYTYNFNI